MEIAIPGKLKGQKLILKWAPQTLISVLLHAFQLSLNRYKLAKLKKKSTEKTQRNV